MSFIPPNKSSSGQIIPDGREANYFKQEETFSIRKAIRTDARRIFKIFKEVVQGGDTYALESGTDYETFLEYWMDSSINTYVLEQDGEIVASYILKDNQPGRGSHVANASYMVASNMRGRGFGGKMCLHSLEEAKRLGFSAMQYNIVVSTNYSAIRLWEKHGFKIVGTTPNGFRHVTKGFVDSHIMYRSLD